MAIDTLRRPTTWQTFTAAPHRIMMFGGAVQLVATLVFWGTELVGRYTDAWAPLATAVPATFAHGFLMLYGLFPFFFFGFLMTTFPRWMNGTPIPRSRYIPPFVLMGCGVLAFYGGLFVHKALVVGGTALFLTGFLLGYRALLSVYRATPAADKFYETLLNTALGLGATGMAAYLLWLMNDIWWFYHFARSIGLWWFLLPVAITVGHRMLPFFSSCVLPDYPVFQPRWSLLSLLALSFAHGVLAIAAADAWLWLTDLPLAGLLFYHTAKWGFRRSLSIRLLAVLHIAFLWLGIAVGLYALQSILVLSYGPGILGRGPLHIAGIGFLVSLTIGMATRVTLGHSGRPLEMDSATWLLFWGVAFAALFRFAAASPLPQASHFNLAAALTWLLSTIPWALRYGAMYLRPRVDGRPG